MNSDLLYDIYMLGKRGVTAILMNEVVPCLNKTVQFLKDIIRYICKYSWM